MEASPSHGTCGARSKSANLEGLDNLEGAYGLRHDHAQMRLGADGAHGADLDRRSGRAPSAPGRRRAELYAAGADGSAAADDARVRPVCVRPRRNPGSWTAATWRRRYGRRAGPCRCGAAAHRLLIVSARLLPPEGGGRRVEERSVCAEIDGVCDPGSHRSAGSGRTRTDLLDCRLRYVAAERNPPPRLRKRPTSLTPEALRCRGAASRSVAAIVPGRVPLPLGLPIQHVHGLPLSSFNGEERIVLRSSGPCIQKRGRPAAGRSESSRISSP